jgi:hypothetical protein
MPRLNALRPAAKACRLHWVAGVGSKIVVRATPSGGAATMTRSSGESALRHIEKWWEATSGGSWC